MTLLRPTSILAQNDNGQPIPLVSTGEGHLEVAIHAPRLPFGSVHTESLTPVFQVDAVYGINAAEITSTTGRAIAGANSATTTGTSTQTIATLNTREDQ